MTQRERRENVASVTAIAYAIAALIVIGWLALAIDALRGPGWHWPWR